MTKQGVLFEGAVPEKKINVGALFCSRFKSWMHTTYRITGRDKRAIVNLQEQWNVDEEPTLRKKIDMYLTDEDPFLEKIGWSLWGFEEKQNKYRVAAAPEPAPENKEQSEDDSGTSSRFERLLRGGGPSAS